MAGSSELCLRSWHRARRAPGAGARGLARGEGGPAGKAWWPLLSGDRKAIPPCFRGIRLTRGVFPPPIPSPTA